MVVPNIAQTRIISFFEKESVGITKFLNKSIQFIETENAENT